MSDQRPPFIIRPAVFLDFAENTNAIIPLKVYVDMGNHLTPLWSKMVKLADGRQYVYVKEAHNKYKTPIYKPLIEEEEESHQDKSIDQLLDQIAGDEQIILSHEEFIDHLIRKIKDLENCELSSEEIGNRELQLFYANKEQDVEESSPKE